jgi:hypothetical protein
MYLAAGVYLSEAPGPLPPPVTNCMNTCIPVLIHTGKGGGEPVRRLEGRLFTRGVENTNMTHCISCL